MPKRFQKESLICFFKENLKRDFDPLSPQDTSKLMMTENVAQLAAQQSEISELKAKLATLEKELIHMESECKQKKVAMQEQAVVCAQAGSIELEKLQKLLALRENEMGQVKRLARSIVEQRTQLELFFHEALAQVKQEIIASQIQYRYMYTGTRYNTGLKLITHI